MDKDKKEILIDKSYEIIKEENLIPVDNIRIADSLSGVSRRLGSLRINQIYGGYSIVVNSRSAVFYANKNGKYINKEGERFSRAAVGEDRSDADLTHTMAHELAHLRFWEHGAKHLSYTEYIYQLLIKKLNWECFKLE